MWNEAPEWYRELVTFVALITAGAFFVFAWYVYADSDFHVQFLSPTTVTSVAPPSMGTFDFTGAPAGTYALVNHISGGGTDCSVNLFDYSQYQCFIGGSSGVSATSTPFSWSGSAFGSADLSQPYVNLVSPESGSTTPSVSVTLSANVYVPDTTVYTRGFFQVENVNTGFSYLPIGFNLSPGLHQVTASFTFGVGDKILWNVKLSSTTDASIQVIQDWSRVFSVVQAPPTIGVNFTPAFATTSYQQITQFQNLVNVVKGKMPFAYFFSVLDSFSNPDVSGATSTPGIDLTISAVSTTSGTLLPGNSFTIPWHAFGSDTITRYFTGVVQTAFFYVAMIALWASWLWGTFHGIRSILKGEK